MRNLRRLRNRDGSCIASVFLMRTAHIHATALPMPALPAGIDLHYEMEHRLVWNNERGTNEEHIFVYEVSWIPELGVPRWFFARRLMPAGGEVCTAKKNCVSSWRCRPA